MDINIQGGKSANIPRLLNSNDKDESILGQIESNQDGIKTCLESLRKQSAETLGLSRGLSCLKILAGEQYATKNEPTKLTGSAAVTQVLSEIGSKPEPESKTLLANAAIMLAKQGKMPKPRQQQVFELAGFADEMPRYDAYACLLNNHNQSNANIIDKMMPQAMIDSLREGLAIPSDGLPLVEIAVISANAYQLNSESDEPQPIRQLLAQDALLALSDYAERNDSALATALAFKHVSSNYLSLSSVASVNQNNPYSGIQLLTNSKGLLGRDAKDHPSPKRDANSILGLVSKSPDASLFLRKLASSGVLTKGTAKQVLDGLLSYNDLMKKQDSVGLFLKNLKLDGSELEQSDLLEMYKKTSSYKYSQPVKQALDELMERAERLNEMAVDGNGLDDEDLSEEADPYLSEMRQAHNIYNNCHANAISDDNRNFAQYTNAIIKTTNAYGEEDELAFSDFASPAELLSNLELHQVTDIKIDDFGKDDFLTADIKAAFLDYVDGVDDRLNLYMTQPISKSIHELAGRLGTDEYHLASLHSTKQPAAKMLQAVDAVQYTNASVILQAADDSNKKRSIPIKELKSATDFNSAARRFIEEADAGHVTATLSSSQLNNEFKTKIEESFAQSLSQLQHSIGQDSAKNPIVNTHLDKLLCLPVSELSDKMKTNTIFINDSKPLETDGLVPKRPFR